MKICSVEGCDKKHWARGHCNTHYAFLKRKGTLKTLKERRICNIPNHKICSSCNIPKEFDCFSVNNSNKANSKLEYNCKSCESLRRSPTKACIICNSRPAEKGKRKCLNCLSEQFCVIDGCLNKKGKRKGMCGKHYTRLIYYGTIEAPNKKQSIVEVNKILKNKGLCFCTKCHTEKPLENFRNRNHRSTICWECTKIKHRRYMRTLKTGDQSRYYKMKGCWEGLSFLLREEIGKCFVCGGNNRLGLDHRHLDNDKHNKLSRVRGLLCSNCNTAEGLLKGDPEIITKLLTYTTNTFTQNLETVGCSLDRILEITNSFC